MQYGKTDDAAYPSVVSGGKNTQSEQKAPSWLVKLDWHINDNNLLELTAFSDKRKTDTAYYYTDFAANSVKPERGSYVGTLHEEDGGENYALKYTGYLTDSFTLTALAGHGEFSRSNHAIQADGSRISYDGNLNSVVGGCPIVRDQRPLARKDATGIYSGCDFATSLNRSDAKDTRDHFSNVASLAAFVTAKQAA